jgi:hypothetical protein
MAFPQEPSMVTKAVELIESLRQTSAQLQRSEEEQIKRETLQRLGALDPILQHIMEVKLVRNERRNFINVRIKADYTTLLFQHSEHGVFNCFFLSDKLEPFVTITAVSFQPSTYFYNCSCFSLYHSSVSAGRDNLSVLVLADGQAADRSNF